MTMRLTIDSAGRVLIPKSLRDKLALAPGGTLDVETAGESITLRPTRATAPLKKEKGVWVFRTGRPLPASVADTVVNRMRDGKSSILLTPSPEKRQGAVGLLEQFSRCPEAIPLPERHTLPTN